MTRTFRQHDLVVYEKPKHGTHPGQRARSIRPTPAGDTYDYVGFLSNGSAAEPLARLS